MLERLDRREPVSWLGLTSGGRLQISVARHDPATGAWKIARMYGLRSDTRAVIGHELARRWHPEQVRTALVQAFALVDPEHPAIKQD